MVTINSIQTLKMCHPNFLSHPDFCAPLYHLETRKYICTYVYQLPMILDTNRSYGPTGLSSPPPFITIPFTCSHLIFLMEIQVKTSFVDFVIDWSNGRQQRMKFLILRVVHLSQLEGHYFLSISSSTQFSPNCISISLSG